MRCGHDYVEDYDPKAVMTERWCSKCRSNSVRPIESVAKAKAKS
jgi:hypothetical protein